MKPSQFNVVVSLPEGPLVVNTLSGAVDATSPAVVRALQRPYAGRRGNGYLVERGYLVDDSLDEIALLEQLYRELLLEKRRHSPLHAILVLTFRCNLRCTYCWQQQDLPAQALQAGNNMTTAQVGRVFEALESLRRRVLADDQPPVIQLFGGEPLLPSNRLVVEHALRGCSEREWPVQITTNGVYLERYTELIVTHGVSEVQVTVDGPGAVHDARRKGSRYEALMRGLDSLLATGDVYVKLRANVDMENVDDIPALAAELIDRQWYSTRRFYAYLAPTRDQGSRGAGYLACRPALLERLETLKEAHPEMEIFDMLGWDGYQAVRSLVATGRLPVAKAYICEANLNQFVFNPGGEIHVCGEQAHATSARVGRYDPELQLDDESFRRWYEAGPLDLERCRGCAWIPVCGGGCQLFEGEAPRRVAFCRSFADCFRGSLARAFTTGQLP